MLNIKPDGAKKLLDAVLYYGLWPNDCIMCKQLITRMGVTRQFYTKVQKMEKPLAFFLKCFVIYL